ncbi:ABC transporter permease [Mycoplasma sp. AC1221]
MTAKEFNKKYKLSFNGIQTPFALANNQKTFSNIAGKPKKLLLEILKRFFKSWPSVLFLIVFIIVLLISIIVTISSKYSANESISDTISLNLIADQQGKTIFGPPSIKSLPASYQPYITLKSAGFEQDIPKYKAAFHENYGGFFDKFLDISKDATVASVLKTREYTVQGINGPTKQSEILIDMYRWYRVYSAYLIFDKSNIAQNLNQNEYQSLYDQALALNPQTKLDTFLGTTAKGIDIWTRSWVGTWKALRLAFIVASIQTIIGVIIGAYLGFHVGSKIDTIMMRLIDIFSAPPTLIWLLIAVTLFGTSDLALGIALVVVGWVGSVGGTRLFIITVKDSEFITASKSVGASKIRLIYKHALPGIIGKIATNYVTQIPSIILSVSSLAFLGFFSSDTDVNLGEIIFSASSEAAQNFWSLLLPALILLSISVSLYFIALGVHDALDPKVIKTK